MLSTGQAISLQLGLVAVSAAAYGPSRRRRSASLSLGAIGLVVPWLAPSIPALRGALAMVSLLPLWKGWELRRELVQRSMPFRLWYFSVPFDARAARSVSPAVDLRALGRIVVHAAVATAGAVLVGWADEIPQRAPHIALRVIGGTALIYGGVDAIATAIVFAHRLVGIAVRPIQHHPVLSRSAMEFWSRRWNRPVHDWLRRMCFVPLARRGRPVTALLTAFGASAMLHVWIALPPLGVVLAAQMGLYFLLEGVIVLAEARLAVGRMAPVVQRAWACAAVLGPAPLFVGPALELVGL